MNKYAPVAMILLLSGCVSQWDMQGVDPKDYYAAHPIKNKLDARSESFSAHFVTAENRISGDEASKLRSVLHGISPQAVQAVQVELSDADMHNDARKASMIKFLRSAGYNRDVISFTTSATLARDDAQLDINYLVVVMPDCPDWRTSPVTTYSNTMQGNFNCANEVNLGAMVADPHDLVRGAGTVAPDAERNARTIEDYKAGKDYSATSSAGGGSSGSTTNSASAVASGVSGLTGGQ